MEYNPPPMDPDDPDFPHVSEQGATDRGRAIFRAAFDTSEALGRDAGAIALRLLESEEVDPAAPGFRMLDLIVRVETEFQLRLY